MSLCVFLALALAGVTSAQTPIFSPKIVNHSAPTVLRRFENSTLFQLAAPGYAKPILLLDLRASSRFDAGVAYGRLLAHEIVSTFTNLIQTLIPNSKIEKAALFAFLDFEWSAFLEQGTPQEFRDEMAGIAVGARAVGVPDAVDYIKYGVVVSSVATGDVEFDIEQLLHEQCGKVLHIKWLCDLVPHEGSQAERSAAIAALASQYRLYRQSLKMGCSHFGVWGPRTAGGRFFSARNLDWLADSGIADNKLLTVFHPSSDNGVARHPHVTVGFAGLLGALAGMSADGITVHEAGDDNDEETFVGMPWTLRLRYIMERASTLAEARALWRASDNTLGINHGIGSAADSAYLILEVKANYTAFFSANDAREKASPYGSPLPYALWRTNHGYDPEFIRTARGNGKPHGDSLTRYMLIHDTFTLYGGTLDANGTSATQLIGDAEAVNLTAVPGDKGGEDRSSFVTCSGPTAVKGSNILSVTFVPAEARMYVAFEEGRGAAHVPACCGSYVAVDMKPFF
eukprot:TRINITY_DN506_c0_g1_i1.p1 TRINITY_DN506_c0_g1~~TRINITY_DN506_c0_g1_i1.p1  ORF type:complete len:513 (-),score=123.05 TRINITY_DN506_c0_g1_i1:1896-3434(-)